MTNRLMFGAAVFALSAWCVTATRLNAAPSLIVWVYACDPYDLSYPCEVSWIPNPFGGQQTCTMEEAGATTGQVQCGASAPSGTPGNGPYTSHAPVSILD